MKKLCLILTLAAVAGMASADLTLDVVGAPVETGSWTQQFVLSAGLFDPWIDCIAVKIAAPDTFKNEALSDFDAPILGPDAWAMIYQNDAAVPTVAAAAGALRHTLSFDMHFEGDWRNDVVIDLVAYNGSDIVRTREYEGDYWSIRIFGYVIAEGYDWDVEYNNDWRPDRGDFGSVPETDPVPAPAAIVLGGLGLGLIGWVQRKRLA